MYRRAVTREITERAEIRPNRTAVRPRAPSKKRSVNRAYGATPKTRRVMSSVMTVAECRSWERKLNRGERAIKERFRKLTRRLVGGRRRRRRSLSREIFGKLLEASSVSQEFPYFCSQILLREVAKGFRLISSKVPRRQTSRGRNGSPVGAIQI